MSIKIVFIQKDDGKSAKWAEAAREHGITMISQPGSPIKAPFFLLSNIFKSKTPDAYIVRYLNDYPSFLKTTIRFGSELLLIILCFLFRIEVFWICHNVDKETSTYFPRISRARRTIHARVARAIFVTDPLLLSYAYQQFPGQMRKIHSISFGPPTLQENMNIDDEQKAIKFIEDSKSKAHKRQQKFLVALCAGSPGAAKTIHFDYLEILIKTAGEQNIYIVSIVAGNFHANKRAEELLQSYQNNDNVYIFDKFTIFSADFVKKYVDFYWRTNADLSVPYTVYEAASLRKPVLALEKGFLPDMIDKHKIGAVIDTNFKCLDKKLKEIPRIKTVAYSDFLKNHRWELLAEKINEL